MTSDNISVSQDIERYAVVFKGTLGHAHGISSFITDLQNAQTYVPSKRNI